MRINEQCLSAGKITKMMLNQNVYDCKRFLSMLITIHCLIWEANDVNNNFLL
jgi:hypothetical protein